MGEVQNVKHLEVMLPIRGKVIKNKVITLDLAINNVVFTQKCFVIIITNSIILGSDFLDTQFAVLDKGLCAITLLYTDYMLTTSFSHDPIHY